MALEQRKTTRFLARVGTWIAVAFFSVLDILKSFLNFKNEDGLLTKGKKAVNQFSRLGAYLAVDYGLALLTPGIVAAVKFSGLSFPWVFLAVWVYGFAVAGVFVLFFEKTGEDLSLGVDLRRAKDAIQNKSRLAGIVTVMLYIGKAIFWTGPEQVITFFRKEIGTIPRVVIVLLLHTALQSFIWATLYSLGYDLIAG